MADRSQLSCKWNDNNFEQCFDFKTETGKETRAQTPTVNQINDNKINNWSVSVRDGNNNNNNNKIVVVFFFCY